MTPGRSSEPVYPQATSAAEEMPEECSQTPAGTAPGGGPAEPDLPNRNTESNTKAKANTGAAKGGRKRKRTVDDDASIGPPFGLLYKNRVRCYLRGTVDGKPKECITSMRICPSCQHEKIMERFRDLAKAGHFKTKSDVERTRNYFIRKRRVGVCSLDLD